jgi:hypothetical protein
MRPWKQTEVHRMATDASDMRTRRTNGPSAIPVVWHLESQGGRNFTIGVYAGVVERLNATTGEWVQTAKGYFAEISERILSTKRSAGSTLKRYDRNREAIFATHDMAHTSALRRIRTIVQDDETKARPQRSQPNARSNHVL